MAEKVIFDTDPGIDDALALLLLAASPEIELRAITVTHGNTSQEKCLLNALQLVDLSGINAVPVVKDGAVVPGHVMKVTLSCDHRSVDGASGAAFLQDFKAFMENPVRMLANGF